jgi:hypothetical protein
MYMCMYIYIHIYKWICMYELVWAHDDRTRAIARQVRRHDLTDPYIILVPVLYTILSMYKYSRRFSGLCTCVWSLRRQPTR